MAKEHETSRQVFMSETLRYFNLSHINQLFILEQIQFILKFQ